ncbi:MAG: toll/interleukin-1 receptor domain-containing protein [Ignavibacteriaceae bacterium]|nr:toll/interleukin-1 receptor domain-containing protein [Ignavibacteriaceae bacterium]
MAYDCFISYSSSDLKFAESLYNKLSEQNLKIWFDKTRLEPGFDWYKEIEKGCENSRIVLPVLTPRWKNSEWTKYETYGAEAVIPLIFEGAWENISTPPLEQFQAEVIDFKSLSEHNWKRLFNAINRVIEQPIPQKTNKIIHLHYRTNDYFVGREKELIRIHEELHSNPTASLTQGRVRVITANGGYGKTTLARHYAEKFWKCYTQIFWVDTRLGYENEFAHIHDLMYPDLANIGLKESDKASRILQEFNSQEKRLLILDNADDEETAVKWIPKSGGCHTILTSRFAGWSASVKTFPIWLLDKEPTLQFLQQRSGFKAEGDELEACCKLAEKLGYLPLAIEQAAAYIFKQGRGFGFSDYLEIYNEAEKDLLALRASSGSTEYPDSLFSTWKASIQKMPNGAKVIFRLCSFLAATPIPLDLFIKNGGILAECTRMMEAGITDCAENQEPEKPSKFLIRQWKDALIDYSLIHQLDADTIIVHALVQGVERLSIEKNEYNVWAQLAVILVNNYIPSNSSEPASWPCWRHLLRHVEHLFNVFEKDPIVSVPVNYPKQLADFYFYKSKYSNGLVYAQKVVEFYKNDNRIYNSDMLNAIHRLGYYYERLGNYQEAGVYYEEELRGREQLEGARGVGVLRATHRLACLKGLERNYEEAIPLYESAIQGMEEKMGGDNYETLITINDLGWLYYRKGDYQAAEPYYRKSLIGLEKHYGLEYRDTHAVSHNLALLLELKGELDEAEKLWQRAVNFSINNFGVDHEDTKLLISSLSDLLVKKGEKEKSLDLEFLKNKAYEQDPDYEKTEQFAIDLNNLGLEYRKIGRINEAEICIRKALLYDIKIRGGDHPKIAHRLNNLSSILLMQGKHNEAKDNLINAWNLKNFKHDITSPRILYVRLTTAILQKDSTGVYIGQLKTLFSLGPLPDYAEVSATWEPVHFVEYLRTNLGDDNSDFLLALADVTNDFNLLWILDKYDIWKNQEPVSLDVAWSN